MKNLNDKVALITGGTKGIGYGIAVSLLQQGINVAITGRKEETAKQAAEELNKA
ncbi:MAG TPA: short-chain dehydrogenase, partial [Flavobacteriaceae bacterium]|nr:short-chain dehydrogenase [Flavobacteriaceae bacterium]